MIDAPAPEEVPLAADEDEEEEAESSEAVEEDEEPPHLPSEPRVFESSLGALTVNLAEVACSPSAFVM